jgi:hypothetical protein
MMVASSPGSVGLQSTTPHHQAHVAFWDFRLSCHMTAPAAAAQMTARHLDRYLVRCFLGQVAVPPPVEGLCLVTLYSQDESWSIDLSRNLRCLRNEVF